MKKENVLKEMSFLFAIRCVKLYKYLCDEKKEFVISKQMLRSGTSVGANVREANNAQSKADFIHKLSIAQKECDETLYWVELMLASGYIDQIMFDSLSSDAEAILKIIKSSILTSKNPKQ